MSDIIIHGDPRSTFCRSARMACVEKGISHRIEPVDLSAESYRKIHPFAKMPAMDHGGFRLFEMSAIMRYVDENFDEPSLQPGDGKDRARMEQWISVNNDYIAGDVGRRYLLEYFMPSGPDGAPDRTAI
jgi:glutathione S-transferase